MYTPVGFSEIIDRVEHIQELHRQIRLSNDRERIGHQRRERKIKTSSHTYGVPTLVRWPTWCATWRKPAP